MKPNPLSGSKNLILPVGMSVTFSNGVAAYWAVQLLAQPRAPTLHSIIGVHRPRAQMVGAGQTFGSECAHIVLNERCTPQRGGFIEGGNVVSSKLAEWKLAMTALLAALALVLLPGPAAVATPAPATSPTPVGDVVTDPTGFFGAAEVQQLRQAAASTREQGLSPYFVVVPDFSGWDGSDWCVASADASNLPNTAIVYVLAYEDRDSDWCTALPENSPIISDDQIEDAWYESLDLLADSDPLEPAAAADAGVYFAKQLAAQAKTDGSSGAAAPSPSTSGGSSWGPFLVFMLALVAIAVFFLFRSSKKQPKTGKATKQNTEQLVTAAQQQLVAADELVRAAEDEVQFARAQFGPAKTDQLAAAVKTARSGLTDAFTLLPRLDTASSSEKAQIAQQITNTLSSVMPPVKAAQEQLQADRDREIGAETQLLDLQERIAEARRSLPSEQKRLADLGLRFTPTQLASLQDKPAMAEKLLDSAADHLNDARLQLATNRASAVESIDTASTQLALALSALEAVRNAETQIGDSDRVLAAAIASISSDLDDVSRLASNQLSFQALVSDAQAAITEGQAARAGRGDPLGALAHLRSAEDALDQALAPLRGADEQNRRMAAQATERIAAAEALVGQAQMQAQAAGGRLSLQTRTAVSNAASSLSSAKASLQSNPSASISASNAAEQQARAALSQMASMPAYSQAPRRSSSNSMLWGMLLGSMMSGGGGRSSYGRTPYSQSGFGSPPPRSRGTSFRPPTSAPRSSGFRSGGSSRGGGGFRGGGSSRGGGGFRGGGGRSGKF